MKRSLLHVTALGVALALSANAADQTASSPGHIDFGKFTPPAKGQFVEVNIPSSLINMATRLARKSEPETARVLGGLKSIRVNVIGLDDSNREEIKERIESVRNQLDARGWERLVAVKENGNDVGIYTKLRGEEAVEGIALTVFDGGKEAVFINIVGDIRPEQLAALAERLNIEPLKEVSKQLGSGE